MSSVPKALVELSRQLDGRTPWLASVRAAALAHLVRAGLPSTKDEAFRYTNFSRLAELALHAPDLRPLPSAELEAHIPEEARDLPGLVFVDGRARGPISPSVPLPQGVRLSVLSDPGAMGSSADAGSGVSRLGTSLQRAPGFVGDLNGALLSDGAVLEVEAGAEVTEPIVLVHVGGIDGGVSVAPRVLASLGPGARAVLVELFVGAAEDAPYLTSAVADLELGTDAALTHVVLQLEGEEATHVGEVRARVGRGAALLSQLVSVGARLARRDTHVVFTDEGASCTLEGLYVGSGRRHVDQHTVIDHAAPRCMSREVYMGILTDSAVGVFHGEVFVRPGAEGSDARQASHSLLLSDTAVAHTRPQLEILADDVKCSHGATVGQLDDEARFYLRSRGIPAADADSLLTQAFARSLLDALPAWLTPLCEGRLARALTGSTR